MKDFFSSFFNKYGDNKIFLLVIGGIITLFLNKISPKIWSYISGFIVWIGMKCGGLFAFKSFHKRYLDWIVTEHSELKLTGIVTTDNSKKPQLEQVFLSLQLDKQKQQGVSEDNPLDIFKLLGRLPTWSELREIIFVQRKLKIVLGPENSRHFSVAKKELKRNLRKSNRKRFLKKIGLLKNKTNIDKELEPLVEWIKAYSNLIKPLIGNFQIKLLLENFNFLALLGAPGAGKTTLLQYLALTYGREKAHDPGVRKKGVLKRRLGIKKWRLPIFVRLSSVAGLLTEIQGKEKDPSIVDILHRILPPDLQADKIAEKFFIEHLKKGNCILLFDGLDEVATELEFQAVVRAINSLCVAYKNNQFVVTSRIAGWRSGINSNFELFYVNDLSEAQINTFIDTWYMAVEQNGVVGQLKNESSADKLSRERRAAKRANDLKTTLAENIGIRRLAINPMLLSIIAVVHRSLATLPKERSKLYSQCSKILLEQWDISRGLRVDDTKLKLEQKEAIMRRLAFAFHTGEIGDKSGGREASRAEVEGIISLILPSIGKDIDEADHLLRMLIERSGIIIERQRDILTFGHHTFQEYFTAQYLAIGENSEHRNFLLQKENILTDWWREVILLYSGLLSDSSEFIKSIHDSQSDDLCQKSLRLAGLCLNESVEVKNTVLRKEIVLKILRVKCLEQELNIKDINSAELYEYLMQWVNTQNWFPNAAIDTVKNYSPTTHKILADSLSDEEITVKKAALKSISYLQFKDLNEKILALSLQCFEDENEDVKLQAIYTFDDLYSDSTHKEQILLKFLNCLEDESSLVSNKAAQVLKKSSENIIITDLVLNRINEKFANKKYYYSHLLEALGSLLLSFNETDLNFTLEIILKNYDPTQFIRIIKTLSNLKLENSSPRLVSGIIDFLKFTKHGHYSSPIECASFKNNMLSHPLIIQYLIELLEENKGQTNVLFNILLEVSKYRPDLILPKIYNYLSSDDFPTLRLIALNQLSRIPQVNLESLFSEVWTLSLSKSKTNRKTSANALSAYIHTPKSGKALERIKELCVDRSSMVRVSAISKLSHFEKTEDANNFLTGQLMMGYNSSFIEKISCLKFLNSYENLSENIAPNVLKFFNSEITVLETAKLGKARFLLPPWQQNRQLTSTELLRFIKLFSVLVYKSKSISLFEAFFGMLKGVPHIFIDFDEYYYENVNFRLKSLTRFESKNDLMRTLAHTYYLLNKSYKSQMALDDEYNDWIDARYSSNYRRMNLDLKNEEFTFQSLLKTASENLDAVYLENFIYSNLVNTTNSVSKMILFQLLIANRDRLSLEKFEEIVLINISSKEEFIVQPVLLLAKYLHFQNPSLKVYETVLKSLNTDNYRKKEYSWETFEDLIKSR